MNLKGECPSCGIIRARPRNEPDDWSDGASWECPLCKGTLDAVQCRQCRRMVNATWFGFCSFSGCDYVPVTPAEITDAIHNLERILSS